MFSNTIVPRRNCRDHPLRQGWRLPVKIAIHVALEVRVLSSTEGEVSIDRYRPLASMARFLEDDPHPMEMGQSHVL
jgi:hypothetical protein